MAWAQEMKSLVSDIKISTKDRLQFVKDNKADTHKLMDDLRARINDIVKDTRQLLAQFDREMKEMTADLKAFLSKSEKDRMADFKKMMTDIQARVDDVLEDSRKLIARFAKESKERAGDVKELLAGFDKEMKEMAKDLKDLLAKSEQNRMADFKTTMKDIRSRIENIQKHVADLLGDYAGERKEAAANWGVLRKREMAIAEEKIEEVVKGARKAKKHKTKTQ